MATIPSIKGSVFETAVTSLTKLLEQGRIDRKDALRWLEESDFEIVDAEISVAKWYDVQVYHRINCLLREVEGRGRNDYLRDQGRETARRLIEMGLYSQMEYLKRTQAADTDGVAERSAAFGRDLKRLNTLSASILNFTRWEAAPDPEHENRYRIEVHEAAGMPETLIWRSDGFINEMASVHAGHDLWSWKRESDDLVLFRMNREI
jgi:hypothetical protein